MHDAALVSNFILIYLHKAIDGLIVVYNGYGNKMKTSKNFLAGALIFSACCALSTVALRLITPLLWYCFRYDLYGDH
jgi:hypothetical protein